jgi:hypothetical protein
MSRKKRARRRVFEPNESLTELREELAALKEENAVLRSEQQRPLHVGKAAAVIRDRVTALAGLATDEGDDAWGALAATTVLRETLVAACRDLETAIHHVHVQLTRDIPTPELDRRRTDRDSDRWLRSGEVVAPGAIEAKEAVEEPVEAAVIEPENTAAATAIEPGARPDGPAQFELEWLTMVRVPEAAMESSGPPEGPLGVWSPRGHGSALNGSMKTDGIAAGSMLFEADGHDDHVTPQHGVDTGPAPDQPEEGPKAES